MKHLFLIHTLAELHLDEEALISYEKLHEGVFEHSLYIKSQIAKVHYSLRGKRLFQLDRVLQYFNRRWIFVETF